jgi:hypothetical protein
LKIFISFQPCRIRNLPPAKYNRTHPPHIEPDLIQSGSSNSNLVSKFCEYVTRSITQTALVTFFTLYIFCRHFGHFFSLHHQHRQLSYGKTITAKVICLRGTYGKILHA